MALPRDSPAAAHAPGAQSRLEGALRIELWLEAHRLYQTVDAPLCIRSVAADRDTSQALRRARRHDAISRSCTRARSWRYWVKRAGKSTLMNILSALTSPTRAPWRSRRTAGQLRPLPPGRPGAALAAAWAWSTSIALAESLTVLENVVLGTRPAWSPVLRIGEAVHASTGSWPRAVSPSSPTGASAF
jgi:hypothetical protein